MTLEPQTAVDMKQTKYAACDPCTEKIVLYSHLHHQKFNFFLKCKSKVSLENNTISFKFSINITLIIQ
jgi:hypothetical protein